MNKKKNAGRTLPLRFRILHYAAHAERFTVADLLRDLAGEYAGEGQFTGAMLSHHCDSLRAVGMIAETGAALTDGALTITYQLTPYGASRLVYLPEGFKDERVKALTEKRRSSAQ